MHHVACNCKMMSIVVGRIAQHYTGKVTMFCSIFKRFCFSIRCDSMLNNVFRYVPLYEALDCTIFPFTIYIPRYSGVYLPIETRFISFKLWNVSILLFYLWNACLGLWVLATISVIIESKYFIEEYCLNCIKCQNEKDWQIKTFGPSLFGNRIEYRFSE